MTTPTPLQIAKKGCFKLREYFEEDVKNLSLEFVNEHFEVLLQALSEHDGHPDFLKAVTLTTEARERARWMVCRIEPHTRPRVEFNFALIELENEIKETAAKLQALQKRHAEFKNVYTVGIGERSKKILRNAINRHTFWDTRFKIESESIFAGESKTNTRKS